jgi:protein-tyrosine phosphatase
VLNWSYESPTGNLFSSLADSQTTAEQAAASMIRFYRRLPAALSAPIREIFKVIANANTPLLIHCSAGKDRTGVVAAVLLEALGVPRPLILRDYGLTDKLVDYEAILTSNPASALGLARNGYSMRDFRPEIRARLLASDPRYLEASLMMMEERAGSVSEYLTVFLGVDPNHVKIAHDILVG